MQEHSRRWGLPFGRDKMEVSRKHDFQMHSGNEQERTHAAGRDSTSGARPHGA